MSSRSGHVWHTPRDVRVSGPRIELRIAEAFTAFSGLMLQTSRTRATRKSELLTCMDANGAACAMVFIARKKGMRTILTTCKKVPVNVHS